MSQLGRLTLKNFFTKGARPTQAQFGSLIDSAFIFADDVALLGLNNFDPALVYKQGATIVNNKVIYQANQQTGPGNFNVAHWDWLAGGTTGTLIFKGLWDADTDTPQLASPSPIPPAGNFWVVNVAGNTNLSGITDWEIGDWAISDGNQFQKVDNSDTVTNAQNEGSGVGIFDKKSGTYLNFKTLTNKDGSVSMNAGTTSIDLAVEFDDSSTGTTRTWTAFKISNELSAKEPVITGTGNTDDYYSGNKTFQSLQTGVLGTVLTGLSLAVNQVISATDTVIEAFGYLQKQISDNFNLLFSHTTNFSNPHKVTQAQVGLSEVPNVKQNLNASSDPTVFDDSLKGYSIGSTWVNVAGKKAFICIFPSPGGAFWLETTSSSIFGSSYSLAEAPTETSTLSTTFQTKVTLTTGALAGNFRVQWSCVVHNNKKLGEFQLYNAATGTPMGTTLSWMSNDQNERMSLGGVVTLKLSGSSQDISIRYRATDTTASYTQYISDARIEFFRVF